MNIFPFSLTARLAGIALVILFALPLKAAVLVTSFESNEGFTAGSRVNTAGWTLGVSVLPSTAYAYPDGGTMSLSQPSANGRSGTYNFTVAQSLFTSLSYAIIDPTAVYSSGAQTSWMTIGVEDAANTTSAAIRIQTSYGTASGNPYRISYTTWSGGVANNNNFINIAQANLNFAQWNVITLDIDYANQTYNLSLNGGAPLLVTSIALPNTAIFSKLNSLSIAYPSTGIAYYDHITGSIAVPEPQTSALLGCVAIAGCCLFLFRHSPHFRNK